MSNWPMTSDSARTETGGADLSLSKGTVLGSGYTEIIASTSFDWDGFYLMVGMNTNAAGGRNSLRVAIGPAGSEIEIIKNTTWPDRGFPIQAQVAQVIPYFFPIAIKSGTRIALDGIDTSSFNALIIGSEGAWNARPQYSSIVMEFDSPQQDVGVSIDPGASANTKGAYTQIVASTDGEYVELMLLINKRDNMEDADWLLDVAIGASGSEQIIISDAKAVVETGEHIGPAFLRFPIQVPVGTRIAARAQSSKNTTPARLLNLSIGGLVQ